MLKKHFHSLKPLMIKISCGNKADIALSQRRWEKDMCVIVKKGKLKINENCNFRRGLQLRVLDNGSLSIGEHCFINTNVSITCRENITIGDNSKIANNVVIVDHDHDYRNGNEGYKTGKVIIGKNVWIGANCVILRNTEIGDNCVVAAGSVVKGSFESNSIIFGNSGKCTSKKY